jgi:two-component system sensor histidine kinase UhpB
MRERALLIGAALSVGAGPGVGTDVRLRISTKTGAAKTGAPNTGVPPQLRAATAFEGDR